MNVWSHMVGTVVRVNGNTAMLQPRGRAKLVPVTFTDALADRFAEFLQALTVVDALPGIAAAMARRHEGER